LNNQERRFLDLAFIIPSLLDESVSHKFKKVWRPVAKAAWIGLLCDG
jgi:hypothetical protein